MGRPKRMVGYLIVSFALCVSQVVFTATPEGDDDKVDPFDMFNFDPSNVRMKKDISVEKRPTQPQDTEADFEVSATLDAASCSDCEDIKLSQETAMRLLQQYVMRLVHIIEPLVNSTTDLTILDLRVKVNYHGLSTLRRLGQVDGLVKNSQYHSLYETLGSLIMSARPAYVERFYWLEEMLGLSLPMMAMVTLLFSVAAAIIITVRSLVVTRALVSRILFIAFIISVVFNMMEMYQSKVADQEMMLMKRFEEHCPTSANISVWRWLWESNPFRFKEDTCSQYMRAVRINPLFSASPLEAVAMALVKTVVAPLGLIGHGIKDFLQGLLQDLPWQYQLSLGSVMVLLVVLLPAYLMGYRLSLLYNLASIGPDRQAQYHVQAPSLPRLCQSCDRGPIVTSLEAERQAYLEPAGHGLEPTPLGTSTDRTQPRLVGILQAPGNVEPRHSNLAYGEQVVRQRFPGRSENELDGGIDLKRDPIGWKYKAHQEPLPQTVSHNTMPQSEIHHTVSHNTMPQSEIHDTISHNTMPQSEIHHTVSHDTMPQSEIHHTVSHNTMPQSEIHHTVSHNTMPQSEGHSTVFLHTTFQPMIHDRVSHNTMPQSVIHNRVSHNTMPLPEIPGGQTAQSFVFDPQGGGDCGEAAGTLVRQMCDVEVMDSDSNGLAEEDSIELDSNKTDETKPGSERADGTGCQHGLQPGRAEEEKLSAVAVSEKMQKLKLEDGGEVTNPSKAMGHKSAVISPVSLEQKQEN